MRGSLASAAAKMEKSGRNATLPLYLRQFCCRWFTRRREEEEKETLLTQDPQQDDTSPSAATAVRTSQPRVGLRERPSVNNSGGRDAADWGVERRDHVRRVARVGFQSRVEVSLFS